MRCCVCCLMLAIWTSWHVLVITQEQEEIHQPQPFIFWNPRLTNRQHRSTRRVSRSTSAITRSFSVPTFTTHSLWTLVEPDTDTRLVPSGSENSRSTGHLKAKASDDSLRPSAVESRSTVTDTDYREIPTKDAHRGVGLTTRGHRASSKSHRIAEHATARDTSMETTRRSELRSDTFTSRLSISKRANSDSDLPTGRPRLPTTISPLAGTQWSKYWANRDSESGPARPTTSRPRKIYDWTDSAWVYVPVNTDDRISATSTTTRQPARSWHRFSRLVRQTDEKEPIQPQLNERTETWKKDSDEKETAFKSDKVEEDFPSTQSSQMLFSNEEQASAQEEGNDEDQVSVNEDETNGEETYDNELEEGQSETETLAHKPSEASASTTTTTATTDTTENAAVTTTSIVTVVPSIERTTTITESVNYSTKGSNNPTSTVASILTPPNSTWTTLQSSSVPMERFNEASTKVDSEYTTPTGFNKKNSSSANTSMSSTTSTPSSTSTTASSSSSLLSSSSFSASSISPRLSSTIITSANMQSTNTEQSKPDMMSTSAITSTSTSTKDDPAATASSFASETSIDSASIATSTSSTTTADTAPESATSTAVMTTTSLTSASSSMTTAPPTTTTTATTTMTTTTTTTTATTTPMPLVLGQECDPGDDRCNYTSGQCNNGTCGCEWNRYQQNQSCVKYSLKGYEAPRVTMATNDSLTIEWPEVSLPDVQSVAYEVSWQDGQTTGAGNQSQSIKQNQTTISPLRAGSDYRIQVMAKIFTTWGENKSLSLNFPNITGQTAPPKAGQLVNKTLNPEESSATLIFHTPDGGFDNCSASVLDTSSRGETENVDINALQFNCTVLTLKGFRVGVTYNVSVVVWKDGRQSSASYYDVIIPYKELGAVQNLTVVDIQSDSVNVSWRLPANSTGHLTGFYVLVHWRGQCVTQYNLQFQSVNSKQEKTAEGCKTSVEQKFELNDNQVVTILVSDLKPGSTYQMNVSACNPEHVGPSSETDFTTLSLVPGQVQNPIGIAINTSALNLTWERPQDYPGPMDYTVEVFKADQLLPVVTQYLTGYNHSGTIISGLSYFTNYSVTILTNTSAGNSSSVTVGPITTKEQVCGPVTDLQLLNLTFESILLSWRSPLNVNSFGHLKAYIIFLLNGSVCERMIVLTNEIDETEAEKVKQDHCRGGNYSVESLQSDPVIFNITGLEPLTTYTLKVVPYNGAGLGKPDNRTNQTMIGVPAQPYSPVCTNIGRGIINFTWQASEPLTGLTFYHVQVLESNAWTNLSYGSKQVLESVINDYGGLVSNQSTPDGIRVNTSQDSLTVYGLKDFWFYTFMLWASTTAGQSETVSLGTCRTQSSAPGPVQGINIKSLNSTVQVTWSCPNDVDKHGTIVGFQLTGEPKNWTRTDLNGSLETLTIVVNSPPVSCENEIAQTVEVLAQVTYNFTIRGQVKEIKQLGEARSQQFTLPAKAPPGISTPPTFTSISDPTSLSESSFSTRICTTCLTDNRNGQIRTFGVLVCQDEFCDQGIRDSAPWRDMLDPDKMPSWKLARSQHFEVTYRATDQVWESKIQQTIGTSSSLHRPSQSSDVIFNVGNDTSCSERPETDYCNGPVPSGKMFRVRLFSCTDGGCSISQLSQPFMTAEPAPDSTSDSIVIGGAVGGALVAVLVVVVVVVLRMRLRLLKRPSSPRDVHGPEEVVALSDMSGDTEKSRPIKIQDFDEILEGLHADSERLFLEEYQELEKQTPHHSMDVGSDLDHRGDNRWTNILPYDYSRVKLSVVQGDDICAHDYINANYIPGLDSKRDYIATQGPLTRTVPDFWRMVWEQNATAIVMLSDFEELDKRTQMLREKVAHYFPDQEESRAYQYGHITVARTGRVENPKWEIRTLKLTHTKERKNRFIKHFFFKRWTDHEADIEPSDLIDFVKVVRAETSTRPSTPLVVHCSAGVGRTGTYLAVDYFHKYIDNLVHQAGTAGGGGEALDKRTVDIFGRVLAMRDKRRFMVQTRTQYFFIYDAVQELLRQARPVDDNDNVDYQNLEENVYANINNCSPFSGMGNGEDRDGPIYDDVEQLQTHVDAGKNL